MKLVSRIAAAARRPRGRRVGVYALIALACLLALASSLTVWVDRQLLETDRWADQSAQLLESEAVREAVAVRLVDALYAQDDVSERLAQRLPPALDALAVPASAALRQFAQDRAERLLERPRVQALWTEINRRAHARLVAVLEGNEGRLVTTQEGDVVLDLTPLVAALQDDLGLGGRVPEDAGAITIMHSDQLEAAQTAVRVVKALSALLGIAVAALLVGAVVLATGFRREAVRAAALGILVVGLILLVVRRLAGDAVVEALTSPGSDGAARDVWRLGTSIMRDIALGLVVLGLLGLGWAFLAGRTRPAVWVRRRIAPAMRERPVLVFGGLLVVLLLLLLWAPVDAPRQFVGTIVLVAIAAAGLEALRRQTVREFPRPAPPGDAR
jgi:hypothetical protein